MLPALSCFSSSLASCFFALLLAPAGFFLTFFCFGVYFYLHENFHFFLYFFFFFFFFSSSSSSCRFLFLLSFLPFASCLLFPRLRFAPLVPMAPFCTFLLALCFFLPAFCLLPVASCSCSKLLPNLAACNLFSDALPLPSVGVGGYI